MASARRTYDTDSIYLRRIFARDSNNYKISTNYVLVTDSNGEGQWVNSSELVLSAGYYYLSTAVGQLSNYVFTPMNYITDPLSGNINEVDFLTNTLMKQNLNVVGLTTLGGPLQVNNSIQAGDLTANGTTNLGNTLTITGGTSGGFGSIEQVVLNNGTNLINALGYDSANNAYIRTSNSLNFYNGKAFITATTPATVPTLSVTPGLVQTGDGVNLEVQGNLYFRSISTGSMSLYWLSAATAAIDTLNVKIIGASTISTPFLYADSISTNKFWANEYNINQFNFQTLSAGGFYAGTISSGRIFSQTISSGSITADSISVGNLYFNQLNVSSLQANSISTGALFLDSISTGFVNAGTISTQNLLINSLSTGTFYTGVANISTLNISIVGGNILAGQTISTGFLQVPFISTLYGEFGLVSSLNYIGPLASTQVVEASTANIGFLEAGSTLVNYLSAGTAVFSQLALPTASVGVLSTGVGTTGLGIFGSISSQNMSVNSAYIQNATFGNYAFLGPTLFNTLTVSSLNVSSLSTAVLNVPSINVSSLQARYISSGLLVGDNIQAQILDAAVANITTLNLNNGNVQNMVSQIYRGEAVSTVSVEANTISTLSLYTHSINTDILNINDYNVDNFTANTLSVGQAYVNNLSTFRLNATQISCGLFVNPIRGTSLTFTSGIFSGNLTTSILNSGNITNTNVINTSNMNSSNITCSNSLTVLGNSQLQVLGTLFASNGTGIKSYFDSSIHTSLYATNGYIQNLSFINANFSNVTINNGNFSNINVATALIGCNMCAGISSGIITTSILNASTLNTNTFATNNFTANVITALTISTGTFQLNNLSVATAYIGILSAGAEYVSSGIFQTMQANTLNILSNLGVATTTPITTLDVNGSLNVGNRWRFFLGLGENIGDTGATIKVSSDGKNWQDALNTFTKSGRCALWTGKLWVAGGGGANVLKYSGDGLNWNNAITDYNEDVNTIVEINNSSKYYVAAGKLNSLKENILISQDGITWSYPTGNNRDYVDINKIVQRPDGQILMAVTTNIQNARETIYYGDSNSITSNEISVTAINLWNTSAYDILWTGNQWIGIGKPEGVGYFTSTIIQSSDGINWNGVDGDFDLNTTTGYCLGYNGQIILAGAYQNSGSNSIKYSYDGSNWSNAVGVLSPETNSLTWNGTKWIAGISSIGGTTYLYSPDGITWASDGFTNTFTTEGNSAAWSGNSNFPVSTVINGPLEVLSVKAETDISAGSNLTYGLSLRNASTVWTIANNYISNVENYSYTKNDVTTPVVYLGLPRYSADSFENIVYASANLTISSLVGSNILSSGTYTNYYTLVQSNVTKLAWIPVPGNNLWKVVY